MFTIHKLVQLYWQNGIIITDHAEDYAEPDYSKDGPRCILVGHWNNTRHRDPKTGKLEVEDTRPERLYDLAERAGYTVVAADEWMKCDGCEKLVRRNPDSYFWQPAFFTFHGSGNTFCHECVRETYTEDVLEELEGTERWLNKPLGIDLENNGYELIDSYETGVRTYEQDHSSVVIAASLREQGVKKFIFLLKEVRQFDYDFSLYVHRSEYKKLVKNAIKSKMEVSPKAAAERFFAEARRKI